MCFRGTKTVSGHDNGMWFRSTCIIVCVLGVSSQRCVWGVQRQWTVMYNGMCFRGTKTVSDHV